MWINHEINQRDEMRGEEISILNGHIQALETKVQGQITSDGNWIVEDDFVVEGIGPAEVDCGTIALSQEQIDAIADTVCRRLEAVGAGDADAVNFDVEKGESK
jgi:hypothetical protein